MCTQYFLFDKVCLRFSTGQWFCSDTPSCSINNIDRHDVTDILFHDVTDISFHDVTDILFHDVTDILFHDVTDILFHDVTDILLKSDMKSPIATDISFFTCEQCSLPLYIHSVCKGL